MLQWFIRFPEFTELGHWIQWIPVPFRENSNEPVRYETVNTQQTNKLNYFVGISKSSTLSQKRLISFHCQFSLIYVVLTIILISEMWLPYAFTGIVHRRDANAIHAILELAVKSQVRLILQYILFCFYRPQGKVMFSQASVSHSVHNQSHGYSVTAHPCYSMVRTHPTGILSCFFSLLGFWQWNDNEQESIPVGCVLPICWPYSIVSHIPQRGLPPGCRCPCR